jgi:hypothetical protein
MQDSFVMVLAPGLAHLPAIKILHRDKFLAPRQLVPPLSLRFCGARRDTAPVPATKLVPGDNPDSYRDYHRVQVWWLALAQCRAVPRRSEAKAGVQAVSEPEIYHGAGF